MDASPSTLMKGRSGLDRTSSNTQSPTNSIKRSFSGRKSSSLSSFDANKSANFFLDSPEVIDYPGQHCVQFLTLLPHQEKLFYLNLFRRKKQYSSNPISHIEHRTKSHVFMEISAYDSPVCRIRICAKEKRNIERVLELFDEYCPVLLKYSNHQELTRVRQSLLPMGPTTFPTDIRQSTFSGETSRQSFSKLPTLRRVPSTRRRDSLPEKAKTGKSKVTKVTTKIEKKIEDSKSPETSGDQEKDAKEKTKEHKAERQKTVLKDAQSEETKATDKEKTADNPSRSLTHESREEGEGDLEREKTLSSCDGDAVNNEMSVLSAIESFIKSEREVLSKPPLPKSKGKSGTPVEICQELETVVEGYLVREREKVEKMKMEEPKTEQKVLDKFRALVRVTGKPPKKGHKEKRMEEEKPDEEGDKGEFRGDDAKAEEAGDDKTKKRKRKRRKGLRPTSGVRRDSRIK